MSITRDIVDLDGMLETLNSMPDDYKADKGTVLTLIGVIRHLRAAKRAGEVDIAEVVFWLRGNNRGPMADAVDRLHRQFLEQNEQLMGALGRACALEENAVMLEDELAQAKRLIDTGLCADNGDMVPLHVNSETDEQTGSSAFYLTLPNGWSLVPSAELNRLTTVEAERENERSPG